MSHNNTLCPGMHSYPSNSCSYPYHSCMYSESDSPSVAGRAGNCMFLEGTIYSDPSAAWVLIAAIIVFFMKAGFMLLESAFAPSPSDRRNVIIIKHIDAFASALGFFIFGCDYIAKYAYDYEVDREFFRIQQPLLWFFKFTFASNAATLLGGCLIDFEYKLRLPAAFISAFVISGVVHPFVARLIWSPNPCSFSPYRYCQYPWKRNNTLIMGDTETVCQSPMRDYFAVDFAGGGAVHLLGGTAGLVVCLFAKFQKWRNEKKRENRTSGDDVDREDQTDAAGRKRGFLGWMYAVNTNSNIEHAALGVLILWFSWFAFNCGSTENISGGLHGYWHSVPSRIAVNMIMCCASGGTLAVMIASWAQLRLRSESMNANEIANCVLSCLVAITAPCPFLTYYQACIVGVLAVICYHVGTFVEYRFGIPDTARVVPVHAVSGLLSLLVASWAAFPGENKCFLHATYEGNVICQLVLPDISFWQLLGMQLLAALTMIVAGLSMALVYAPMYLIQMKWVEPIIRLMICSRRQKIAYEGNLLFASATEEQNIIAMSMQETDQIATNFSKRARDSVISRRPSASSAAEGENLLPPLQQRTTTRRVSIKTDYGSTSNPASQQRPNRSRDTEVPSHGSLGHVSINSAQD